LSLRANNDIGWLFLHLRQPTEAARACQHTLAIQPESLEAQACLERAYAQRGMFVEAVRAAELASSVFKLETLDRAASAREQLNGFWRFRLQQLQSAAQTHWVSPYQLAVHYAFIGDQQRAIEQLHQAFAERIGILVFAKTDPALDAVRSHPRFETLLQNLPEDLR
jgi:tetratricopeptide (TPR) repeat protein